MTDPKIRVSADVSAIQSELQKVETAAQKVNQTLSSGQVGIDTREAKDDLAALEASAKALSDLLDRAAASGDNLAGLDLGAVTDALDDAAKAATQLDQVLEAVGQSSGMSGTVRNTKTVAENLQRAVRAQEMLGREGIKVSRQQAEAAKQQFDRWRQSGARGTTRIRNQEFDDWLSGGWRNYSMDEGEARRHRSRVLESVGVTSGVAEDGTPGDDRQSRRARLTGRLGAAAGALGGMAGGMMGGGDGGMWGAAGNAGGSMLGAGAGMLFGGPVGAVIGAFASQLLGGVGRALDQGIERAGQEGADYSDLRRSLGGTRVDFEELRQSVRYFTDGLGLTYNESAKLARSFAHVANLQDAQTLGRDVRDSAGFARGYGMSPDAAVQFFATMRHYGATTDTRDQRRLALQIGEAVNRGGTSAKMDEVLAAIQGFTQSATRASLSQANTEAYASFMSSLTGLSLPGLKGDPQAAASAMGQADAALRMGGAFGPASKNFSLGLYQRMLPGFTALDQDFINEQGAFGTVGRAFGRDSAAYKLAESRGDTSKMDQYDQWVQQGGNRTMLSMQMQALEKTYGRNTDEFRKAIQSHLGVSASQASALYQAYQNDIGLGGLESSLKGAGVDTSKMSAKQIASMAELATANDSGIKKQATKLLGLTGADALSSFESRDLKKAMDANDPEALRKMVLSLTALHDTTKDQGDLMRKQQADMTNALQKLATELIPLTMTIKDGIIELVRWAAPESDFVKNEDKKRADLDAEKTKAVSLDAQMASLKQQIDGFKETDRDTNGRNLVALHQLKQQREAAVARGDTKAVAAYDVNIGNLESAIRAGSPQGKQDLIDRYNETLSQRNALRNVDPSSAAPLDDAGKEKAAPATSGDARGRPRNLRNNNPGNIEYGDFARRMGATGSDGRFAIFPDRAAGSKAMDTLLQRYSKKDGLKTVRQIVGKWAPSSDGNNVSRYAQLVADAMGVSPDEKLNMDDPKVASALARAMSRVEGSGAAYLDHDRRGEVAASREDAKKATVDPTLDRKAPAGLAPGVGPASVQRHDIRIDNRVTLQDQNGNERGDSVVQTRVSAPVPTGMYA